MHTYIQTYRQTYIHTYRQTDRPTVRHTQTHDSTCLWLNKPHSVMFATLCICWSSARASRSLFGAQARCFVVKHIELVSFIRCDAALETPRLVLIPRASETLTVHVPGVRPGCARICVQSDWSARFVGGVAAWKSCGHSDMSICIHMHGGHVNM